MWGHTMIMPLHSQSALLNLPMELLLIILRQLPHWALLQLAKACRPLNHLCIPILLEHHGVVDPRSSCEIILRHGSYPDALSGLFVATYIHKLRRLSCKFDDSALYPSTVGLVPFSTRSIRRLQKFIARLSSIEEIVITFGMINVNWSLNDTIMKDLVHSLQDLFNTIRSKSCTSLQILHGGTLFGRSYTFEIVETWKELFWTTMRRTLVQNFCPNNNQLHGDRWYYLRNGTGFPLIKWAPNPSFTNRLTTLSITSAFLLLPPCAGWTYALMEHSPITSLTLSLPCFIPITQWRLAILPRISQALPQLHELSLPHISEGLLPTILVFLSQLPLLRKVSLGPTKEGHYYPLGRNDQPILNHLLSISGSPEQVWYILNYSVSCPNLLSVDIIVNRVYRNTAGLRSVAETLSRLRQRFAEMNVKPSISLHFKLYYEFPVEADNGLLTRPGWETLFQAVSGLSLDVPATPDQLMAGQRLEYILAWLALFPAIKRLSLSTEYGPVGVPLRLPDSMLRIIGPRCPGVGTILVNGEPNPVRG